MSRFTLLTYYECRPVAGPLKQDLVHESVRALYYSFTRGRYLPHQILITLHSQDIVLYGLWADLKCSCNGKIRQFRNSAWFSRPWQLRIINQLLSVSRIFSLATLYCKVIGSYFYHVTTTWHLGETLVVGLQKVAELLRLCWLTLFAHHYQR